MTWTIIILAGATMLLLALVMATILGWANRRFHVERNPLIDKALAILPGANCGGCGYVGCAEYAEAVAEGKAPPNLCPVGGESCARKLAELVGVELDATFPYRPIVHCGAHWDDRKKKTPYRGEPTCAAANIISGLQGCAYGCLGLGDCQRACPYDAIHVIDGLATVDYDKCVGCGQCEAACPRHIITMVPFKAERMPAILCSNKDFAADVKAVCAVGCTGCGLCAKTCDLFTMVDNLPHFNYDAYDPDQADAVRQAGEKCPMNRIVAMGKPSEKDKAAVADEDAPTVAGPDFKTTADKAEWWG
ncbi:MAG: RnfABCDGE type electron transport complex subunit B [Phycisphaerae bacterium]|nr:RnfABCDGE type electron transport complex subunit B [Phycisphaerae bacterium]